MKKETLVDYNTIIETISEIVNNDKIYKKGLILIYELNEFNHLKLNETFYYKLNPDGLDFKPTDVFEIEISGIIVKFIKKS